MEEGTWYRYILEDEKRERKCRSLWLSKNENALSKEIKEYFLPLRIVDFLCEGSCLGCDSEKMNQEEHMYCPSGCLHDKQDCDLCPDT